MKDHRIYGIQQVGIGVRDVKEAWKWYIDMFGVDCRIFEDETEARLMLPYTGGEPRSRHAVLTYNLQGGGGFEIWQYKGREPLDRKEDIRIGDIGILACKVKVKDIEEAYRFYKSKNVTFVTKPAEAPDREKTFFIRDPYKNLFQLVQSDSWLLDEKKVTGGSCGTIIGVSDIDKAMRMYSDILGYETVVYDKTGNFGDITSLPGGDGIFRRVLLKRKEPVSGPFCKLFGESYMELIASVGNRGKKIYEGRLWGDPGFIHLCFDIRGMDDLRQYCDEKGFPFTVDTMKSIDGKSFDMGEAAGHFAYAEDPDGTLIEFVETHKVPILKKFGWYLSLMKRDPGKSLPMIVFRFLRFSKVKI